MLGINEGDCPSGVKERRHHIPRAREDPQVLGVGIGDLEMGCSKCRWSIAGCGQCRAAGTTGAHKLMLYTTMVVAATHCVIDNLNSVANLLEQVTADLVADSDPTNDLLEGFHVNNKRRRDVTARYLTRHDLGITQPIQRHLRSLVTAKTYAAILEEGGNALESYTRLKPAEFDGLMKKRHAWKKNRDGELMTLTELVALPSNIPRRGKTPYTHEEVLARHLKRKKPPRLQPDDAVFLYLYTMTMTRLTWDRVGREFGVSDTLAANTFYAVQEHMCEVLYDGPDATVRWPSEQERAENAKKLIGLPGCVGYIDGTRIRHRKPGVGQAVQYSGKVKFHCRNNQVIVDLHGRFINLEPPMHGAAHDLKLWYYSTVSQQRGKYFSPGQYLLCDPGYINNDKLLRVPADEVLTRGDAVKKHVADVHRRHRFVVEYSIGAAKANFPLAGCPGGSTYLKSSHYHGVAWANACALQNLIWDSRETWLRGDAYFSGQWEWWEADYLLKKFQKGMFFTDPTQLNAEEGVTTRLFGRRDIL